MKYKVGTRKKTETTNPLISAESISKTKLSRIKPINPTAAIANSRILPSSLGYDDSSDSPLLLSARLSLVKVSFCILRIINGTIRIDDQDEIKPPIGLASPQWKQMNQQTLMHAQKIRLQRLSLLQCDFNQFINVNFIVYIIALIVPYFLILRKNNQPRIGSI